MHKYNKTERSRGNLFKMFFIYDYTTYLHYPDHGSLDQDPYWWFCWSSPHCQPAHIPENAWDLTAKQKTLDITRKLLLKESVSNGQTSFTYMDTLLGKCYRSKIYSIIKHIKLAQPWETNSSKKGSSTALHNVRPSAPYLSYYLEATGQGYIWGLECES